MVPNHHNYILAVVVSLSVWDMYKQDTPQQLIFIHLEKYLSHTNRYCCGFTFPVVCDAVCMETTGNWRGGGGELVLLLWGINFLMDKFVPKRFFPSHLVILNFSLQYPVLPQLAINCLLGSHVSQRYNFLAVMIQFVL